jgi:hypothetical protein
MTDIAKIFCTSPELWSADDLTAAIDYFRQRQINPGAFKRTGERKKKPARRKAKMVDPRQIELEELIAKIEDPA